MSREFPDFVNPWKAAEGKRAFEGTMPLRWMKRLAPLLAPPPDPEADDAPALSWGDARFSVRFAYDEEGAVTVDLEVEADLPLICQRSMRPYLERVRRHSLLGVVDSVTAQETLPEHYEPVLADHGRIALVDLVEEELLLAVPQVPHDPNVDAVLVSTDGSAGQQEPEKDENVQRPFEGLAKMLEETKRRD